MGMCCTCGHRQQYPICPPDYAEQLKSTLTKGQIQYLYNRFCQFADVQRPDEQPAKYLHKWNFYGGVIQLSPLLPIILDCMFDDRSTVDFVDFANFLSIFQAHTLKTKVDQKNEIKTIKLRMLFNMYDHNRDGSITYTDLVVIMHKLFAHLLNTKQIMHIVESMIGEMDSTGTHQIYFQDFCTAFEAFDMCEMLVVKIPEYHENT